MSLLMDKGDTILCESYTYPHLIESLVIPKGFQVHGIETDAEGIIPAAFSKALEQYTKQGTKPPKLLYTVPVGQNPTGTVSRDILQTALTSDAVSKSEKLAAFCDSTQGGMQALAYPAMK